MQSGLREQLRMYRCYKASGADAAEQETQDAEVTDHPRAAFSEIDKMPHKRLMVAEGAADNIR